MQNPYSVILILNVACTWRNPSNAAFHYTCLVHCEIMPLLIKHDDAHTLLLAESFFCSFYIACCSHFAHTLLLLHYIWLY